LKRFLLAVVLGCILIGSSFAYAAGQGRNSVAVAGGLAWPENIDATWYVTAGFRFHVDDNWAIEPDFGYWKQNEAESVQLSAGTLIYSLSDLHVGGNVLYIGSWGDIGMYAGGGAAAHWRKREIHQNVTPPKNNPDVDETRLGLQILWGLDIPIAHSVDFTVAIRDDFIFRDDDLDTQTVFKAYGGVRFYFD
jgi:opacity protein-like surface antigen